MGGFWGGAFLGLWLALMLVAWTISPAAALVIIGGLVLQAIVELRRWKAKLPPPPGYEPAPPVDPDAEARRAFRPVNGDVPPRPHAPKPRPYVGPPMKLPSGGVLFGSPDPVEATRTARFVDSSHH